MLEWQIYRLTFYVYYVELLTEKAKLAELAKPASHFVSYCCLYASS